MQFDNDNAKQPSVNIEMEAININQQSFRELEKLIRISSKDCTDITIHLSKIRDLLERDSANIFGTCIKGRNIFHVIAQQPDRNPEILSVFGFDNDGNSEGLTQHVSQKRIDELLYMPAGPQKRCPIHLAIANGYVEFVNELLKICPSLISVQDGEGNTPLHITAMSSMPEAVECMKLVLSVMEKNQLVEEILLQKMNTKGQTPIHLMCSKVPGNRDALVATKLEKMLSFECRDEILKSTDYSFKTPLHLLCSMDEQSKDPNRSKNIHDLLRILIQSGVAVNQPTSDDHKRTALHLLALSKLPEMLKILIGQPETDILRKDAYGKMAIHYAAQNALEHRSQNCVKILADWSLLKEKMAKVHTESQDVFRKYLLWDTFEEKDGTKSTALTLACKSQSTKTVEYILRNVYKAKSNFGIWFTGKENDQQVFSLKQVYKYTPAALEFLFDKSIQIDLEKSNEINIEFVTDISVITALSRPIQSDQSISEMKYLGYASSWTEDVQEKILLHPLTQCALHALWQNMLPYKLMWLVLNIVWLAAYWILVPLEYSDSEEKFLTNEVIAAWILAVLSILYLLDELFAMKLCIKRLASPQEMYRKMSLVQIFLTLVCVYEPCFQSLGVTPSSPPSNAEKLCASGGVLLSFFLFWRNIGLIYLPLGIQVEYLVQTLKKILEAFICISAIIIGFQRAFSQILPKQFPSETWSFAKTMVMLTGEFEFADMYEKYKDTDDDLIMNNNGTRNEWNVFGDFVDFGTWNILMFILFLIILPVTFYNLVTGVVVDKIKNMESKLEMYQVRNQIRHINYIQETIVSKFSCFAPSLGRWQPFLSYRHTTNGEVDLQLKVKWKVDKVDEPSFFSVVCHTFCQLLKCFHRGTHDDDPVLCGNFLSTSLRNKMFQNYERNLQDSTTRNDYEEIDYV